MISCKSISKSCTGSKLMSSRDGRGGISGVKSSSSLSVSSKPYLGHQSLLWGPPHCHLSCFSEKKIQMAFRYMFGFYLWNFQFRTLHTEFIHIVCRLYRFYVDIMQFVQLFRLTFLLEGALCVDLLCFFGPVSASSPFTFLFNLSSFHFSKSSLFLSFFFFFLRFLPLSFLLFFLV